MSRQVSNKRAIENLEQIKSTLTDEVLVASIDKAISVLKGQLDLKSSDVYPYNLACAIFRASYINPDEIEERAYSLSVEGINAGLSTLTEREREVLRLRFEERLTLEKIGEQFNITREYVRQIEAKALRKLHQPTRIVRMKVYKYEQIVDYVNENNALKSKNTHLEYLVQRTKTGGGLCEQLELIEVRDIKRDGLDFSTRTRNALCRAGVNTLGEIADLRESDLLRFRNLGVKSLNEIKEVLSSYGLVLKP